MPLSAAPTWLSAAAAARLLGTSFVQPAGVQLAEPRAAAAPLPPAARGRRPPFKSHSPPGHAPWGGTRSRGVLKPPPQLCDIWERSLHPSPLAETARPTLALKEPREGGGKRRNLGWGSLTCSRGPARPGSGSPRSAEEILAPLHPGGGHPEVTDNR